MTGLFSHNPASLLRASGLLLVLCWLGAACGTGAEGLEVVVVDPASTETSVQEPIAAEAAASTDDSDQVALNDLAPNDPTLSDPTPDDPTPDDAPKAAKGTIVAHAVNDSVTAYIEPSPTSDQMATFSHPTPTGGPLVFQALGDPVDGWIEVALPLRPNGSKGWVEVSDVELTRNPYSISVDLAAFTLTVTKENSVVLETDIGVGQTDTPTPIGDFYLIELLQPPDPDGPYGTYAYGLSGYSEVLEEFNGGDGVVGIHGTNQPEALGQEVSHGCIRVSNDAIEEMASFLPLGTPVSISDS